MSDIGDSDSLILSSSTPYTNSRKKNERNALSILTNLSEIAGLEDYEIYTCNK